MQNEERPPVILSSKYLQGKLMEAVISATTSQAQTSRIVRHLAARRGVCQPCEMHLLGSAAGSAGKVTEGQAHFSLKAKSNQCVPAKYSNY